MKTEKSKKEPVDKRKLMVRILCITMVALMLLGVLAAAIPYLSLSVRAADVNDPETATDSRTVLNTAEGDPDNGLLLRVGLQFGTDVTPSYIVTADNGFRFGSVDKTTNGFTPYYKVSQKKVEICQDTNLAPSNGAYVPASSKVTLGGYHLQLPKVYQTQGELTAAINDITSKLITAGIYSSLIYPFPCFINNELHIRIGDFGSTDTAKQKAEILEQALGETPTVVSPDSAALTVIDPEHALILFEFRSTQATLGIKAAPPKSGNTDIPLAITTPVGNSYEGVFSLARYSTGISVTNIVPLENYVAGVIPYEIGTDWDMEALKAFAVIVRSAAISLLNRHKTYNIDMCSGNDCQAYLGIKKQTANVIRAVNETHNIIITYDKKPCTTMYSAVTGGCTVNVEQVWNGGSYPYLRAVETPWEDYETHKNGEWVTEVSEQELYEYLRGTKGYTELRGAVKSVEIEELAKNSTYIYKLKITDIYGNELHLKGTDIIRTALGKYVKSANFVIGKDGEIPALEKNFKVMTPDGAKDIPVTKSGTKKTVKIMTADGIVEKDVSSGLSVLQADGSAKTIQISGYDIPEEAEEILTRTGNKNFVLIGKGWGHGCGFSQWGIRALAKEGKDYIDIINAYMTDVELLPYSDIVGN